MHFLSAVGYRRRHFLSAAGWSLSRVYRCVGSTSAAAAAAAAATYHEPGSTIQKRIKNLVEPTADKKLIGSRWVPLAAAGANVANDSAADKKIRRRSQRIKNYFRRSQRIKNL